MSREKSAADLRAANRGNVPGHLDVAALAKLSGRPDTASQPKLRTEMTWAPMQQNTMFSDAGYWIIGFRNHLGLLFKAVPPGKSHEEAINSGWGEECLPRLKDSCERHLFRFNAAQRVQGPKR